MECIVCGRDTSKLRGPGTKYDAGISYAFNVEPMTIDRESLLYIANPQYKKYHLCKADYNLILRIKTKLKLNHPSRQHTPEQLIELAKNHLPVLRTRGSARKIA